MHLLKILEDQGVKDRRDPINNICDRSTFVSSISSVKRVDDYARIPVKMKLDLSRGESKGYWKYRTSEKWFKQAKAVGKFNNAKSHSAV